MLRLARTLFDNKFHQACHHDGIGGVKTHENALFLYKSLQGDALVKSRFVDYALLLSLGGFLTGVNNLLFIPVAYGLLQAPRKWAVMHYFTFHAELLPHTEQVVFHKAGFLGHVRRIVVDIKNLEKVDTSLVHSKSTSS